jgi:hypothetical protein
MLLVRQALGSSANYDYFIFLQGSTYPLRSGGYIQRFLEKNRDWEFVNLVKMPAPGYPLSKINTLRYPSDMPVRRVAARALAKLGLAQWDYRKYLNGLRQCLVGSFERRGPVPSGVRDVESTCRGVLSKNTRA